MGILLSAFLPAVLAILFIMYMDRYKPEPLKCIIWSFVAGMISVIPAIMLEEIFGPILEVSIAGIATSAAVFEELSKFVVLWIVIRKFKTLDEYIDGIVYATCVGVGFEFLENIEYFISSYESINIRTLLPGHLIFAILMGFYLGKAHFATGWEKKKLIIMSLLIPMVAHFVWDFIAFHLDIFYDYDSIYVLSLIAFLIFYIIIVRAAIKHVKENMKADASLREKEQIEETKRIKAEAINEFLSEIDNKMAESFNEEKDIINSNTINNS